MLKMLTHKMQRGVGLIEVLASLLVLSVGILGVVALQSRAVQFNQGALYETRAAMLAADMVDRMRANARVIGAYDQSRGNCERAQAPISYSMSCFGPSIECGGGDMARDDIAAWESDLAALFPGGGEFDISVRPRLGGASLNDVTISIRYNDSRAESANINSGDVSCRSVVFETVISDV